MKCLDMEICIEIIMVIEAVNMNKYAKEINNRESPAQQRGHGMSPPRTQRSNAPPHRDTSGQGQSKDQNGLEARHSDKCCHTSGVQNLDQRNNGILLQIQLDKGGQNQATASGH